MSVLTPSKKNVRVGNNNKFDIPCQNLYNPLRDDEIEKESDPQDFDPAYVNDRFVTKRKRPKTPKNPKSGKFVNNHPENDRLLMPNSENNPFTQTVPRKSSYADVSKNRALKKEMP